MKREIEKIFEEKASVINRMIERYIPREYNEDSLIFTLGPPRYEYNMEAINKAIADPVWEFLDRGGKRWRPILFLLVCEALGAAPKKLLEFAIIPEIIHNGTLMIDDVEDASEIRRGKPCTYKLFGLDIAINTGNVMYYLPLLALIKNKNKISIEKQNRIYEIYLHEMIRLSFGQAMDIAWHKGLAEANEKQY
ncbi:MAG: polyprenyl synthetase family protein, partial [Candidatus Bathyarchaeota archaeon]|nr:polyprenyl synthetase family protein [Candidatus Bathyarchaeota archaeon]